MTLFTVRRAVMAPLIRASARLKRWRRRSALMSWATAMAPMMRPSSSRMGAAESMIEAD
jgi:hypothetical protein